MEPAQQIIFGPFRFDRTTQRLWQGPREIHVTRSVLRVCIWELRQGLGEAGATPQYIETAGQQGYRFCATTRSADVATRLEAPFVGREAELAGLRTALEQAQRGMCQLVFVAGDPGIGKTTLVRRFLSQVPATTSLRMGWGQCVEHFGAGAAYLPVLEALGQLGRQPGSEHLIATLQHTAPMWLVHLPLLVEPGELDVLHQHAAAHELVARCYDGFSEGCDTVDLQTAKSLLEHCQPVA